MPLPVKKLSFLARVGLRGGVFLLRGLMLTWRIRFSPRVEAYLASKPAGSCLFLWHNRLGMALGALWRRGGGVPFTGLVSASGDGATLAEVMQAFGVGVARGSSSRRAVQATRELMAALETGRNVVVTPDGPRGPVYTVKEGAAQLALHATGGVYVVGLRASRVWRFRSWDAFALPMPWAMVEVDMQAVPTQELTALALQKRLQALNS